MSTAEHAQAHEASPPEVLRRLDWANLDQGLHQQGYALLPGLLAQDARTIAACSKAPTRMRSVDLNQLGWGCGVRLEWADAPPNPIAKWHGALRPYLLAIAQHWKQLLGADGEQLHNVVKDECPHTSPLDEGRYTAPSHLTRLGPGDYMALHHDAAPGVFPLQVVGLLSAPEQDFTGGAFILTEQRPRMQSRAMVIPLQYGDAAIVCTGPHPVMGSRGLYRAHIRQAIGQVRSGCRVGLVLSFPSSP
jgi:hypothetical protein